MGENQCTISINNGTLYEFSLNVGSEWMWCPRSTSASSTEDVFHSWMQMQIQEPLVLLLRMILVRFLSKRYGEIIKHTDKTMMKLIL